MENKEIIFARKIYICASLLGAQSDLLSTIGSWRQEINDDMTFECLDAWIESKIKEQKQVLNYAIMSRKK